MCIVGDIIYINGYKHGGTQLNGHSFIVVSDEAGVVEGLPFDFVANVMSSIKSPQQLQRKMAYPGNFPIANEDTYTDPDNGKDGYVKADQLYYFNKNKIDYKVIGKVADDILNLLLDFIQDGNFELTQILDNL